MPFLWCSIVLAGKLVQLCFAIAQLFPTWSFLFSLEHLPGSHGGALYNCAFKGTWVA